MILWIHYNSSTNFLRISYKYTKHKLNLLLAFYSKQCIKTCTTIKISLFVDSLLSNVHPSMRDLALKRMYSHLNMSSS